MYVGMNAPRYTYRQSLNFHKQFPSTPAMFWCFTIQCAHVFVHYVDKKNAINIHTEKYSCLEALLYLSNLGACEHFWEGESKSWMHCVWNQGHKMQSSLHTYHIHLDWLDVVRLYLACKNCKSLHYDSSFPSQTPCRVETQLSTGNVSALQTWFEDETTVVSSPSAWDDEYDE